jgi:IS5 family transposase
MRVYLIKVSAGVARRARIFVHRPANTGEFRMGQKRRTVQRSKTQSYALLEHINLHHPLVELATMIDWPAIERVACDSVAPKPGRPPIRPRLIAGLLYLQHAFDLSDEEVVAMWVENPYWQVFTGETYLQTAPPMDPSSLSHWRERLGEAGMEELLAQSIEAAKRASVIKPSSLKRVIVDTTVMEKAIAYPTDSALLERSRQHLVKAAQQWHLRLRQNYNRLAPQLVRQIGQYARARQFKRMRRVLRILRTRVGRVHRELERQLDQVPASDRDRLAQLLGATKLILTQQRKDKNKLYALHAPEVECIAKGKARTPYEFGVKVSVVTTLKEGLVVGARSMPGNPYDGHTLDEALEQAEILSEVKPEQAFVDRGYKGVKIADVQTWISGQKRGVTRALRAMIKRRSAIEPTIGHMKADGKFDRNWLKGAGGDAMHAVLCGAGHNVRLILNKLKYRASPSAY